jgi:transketolase
MLTEKVLEKNCVNTLRFLAVDAIQKAKSGHPGMPLGAAPMAYALFTRHLHHDPADPAWANRDRFVLSAGHGSSLQYALLHLSGYPVSLDELKAFRQWESSTPGHPESHITPGIEVTTGPLGQGFANAVGLAIAERHLAATFNRDDHDVVDHFTYAIAGDGDLMEGVSYEAATIAGHLKLGKLIVLFDSNQICLAGSTSLSTTEDTTARFEAAGWHVLSVPDGNDLDAIDAALDAAKAESTRPSLLIVETVIGYGSPAKQGTHSAHGAPLGEDEVAATKAALGWEAGTPFTIPEDVRARFDALRTQWKADHAAWMERFEAYRRAFPDLAAEFDRRMRGEPAEGWDEALPVFEPDPAGMPTRKASEIVLQALASTVPELIGGSADLNPSTYTWLKGCGDVQDPATPQDGVLGAVGGTWDFTGRNIHFGVREHAMGAIANGMAQHGGVLPYCATFLVFSDYMRAPIRLAALSGYRTLFVFTHDSICVGEDGATHQPVEQVMSLRLIPGLVVFRPADANETLESWRVAMERTAGPTALVLSRQAVPTLDRERLMGAENLHQGGYVLFESELDTQLLLIATGAEVPLCLEAAERLESEQIGVRVVSMPSMELFESQPVAYRESVLPPAIQARIVVEAGRSLGWERYAGDEGIILGVDRFGASAPGGEVYRRYGFSVDGILTAARSLLSDRPGR